MKIIITLLLALMPLNFALAQEQGDTKEKRPAHELLGLLNVERMMFDTSKVAFSPFLKQFKGQGYSDEAVKEVSEAADAYFGQVSGDPDLKEEMAKMYEKVYTVEELKELIAFYKSPVGQKSLQLMPSLTQEGGKMGEKYAEKYSAGFKEQLNRIMKKHKPGAANQ